MITSILFMILFAISGICISEIAFARHKLFNRIWLGLTIGLLMLTWLPSLLALFIGFTLLAQIISASVALLLIVFSVLVLLHRSGKLSLPFPGRAKGEVGSYSVGRDWIVLIWMLPILILFFSLLNTHILFKDPDGNICVGQVTFGDLAMHLGFITSIAEQGTFPPQYSIFSGHAVNYPFLCETSASSLLQVGASVRQAYILSAGYAFVLVLFGVYYFFTEWLKKPSRAALATVLFFFGGGFGFFYFFDLSQSGGILQSLIDTQANTVSQTLLEDFYHTPTNIPALGLRWVNPIVDMLLPQRATLFGWAFLFPCLYLLLRFAFEKERSDLIPLGVIAGLMPLIHTHSFLALGIISAVYCVIDLITERFRVKRIMQWLAYAAIACALAFPQLIFFTFRQATESSLVKFNLNWQNNWDSYLWFYIKNMGLIFLLMPIAFLVLPSRDKKIYAGVVFLWLIAELVQFQPNEYDNNKLLFVWYAFTCGLVAKFLMIVKERVTLFLKSRTDRPERLRSYQLCIVFLLTAILFYDLFKLLFDQKQGIVLRHGTAFTLFFVGGMLLWQCIGAFKESNRRLSYTLRLLFPFCLSAWQMISMGRLWLNQYQNTEYTWSKSGVWISLLLCAFGLLMFAVESVMSLIEQKPKRGFCGVPAAISLASYILIFTLTVSSAMTIIREMKSRYEVYSKEEFAFCEQIKSSTEPDAVILSGDWLWNLVTPLTGRNIVTGTGTFLYYHGIETTQRNQDVKRMFEDPENSRELFETYGVKYVLLSNNGKERQSYHIDYAYLDTHGTIVAQSGDDLLYRLDH